MEKSMPTHPFEELTRLLQTSISPVALISGIGLLLLAMANRYARTTDGARTLARLYRDAPDRDRESLRIQIRILFDRSRILRLAIIFASFSIFCVCLLIIAVFAAHFFGFRFEDPIIVFFALSFLSLVAAMLLFIRDLTMSLNALKQELKDFVS